MYINGVGKSEPGNNREQNEDVILIDNELGLYIVADGVGGRNHGEVAARKATDSVAAYIRERKEVLDLVKTGKEPYSTGIKLAEDAVRAACGTLHALILSSAEFNGMGSSITFVLIANQKAIMAHVGNTRLYLFRNEEVHQVSADHTLAKTWATLGMISHKDVDGHAYSNVLTRVVGAEELVQVDVLLLDLLPEDKLLLASNGLNPALNLDSSGAPDFSKTTDDLLDSLIDTARNNGSRDDLSAILVEVKLKAHSTAAIESDVAGKILSLLGDVPLFADLNLVQLQNIRNIGKIRTGTNGKQIVSAGSDSKGMFVLVKGTVVLKKDNQRTEFIKGSSFGELSLLGENVSMATVSATEDCSFLYIPRSEFNNLLRKHPWMGIILMRRLGQAALAIATERFQSSQSNEAAVAKSALF